MGAPKGHKPYNTKGEGGKPKKYTKEFIENEANEFEKWLKNPQNVFFKKFALVRGYHPQRMCEWAHENKRFAECLEDALAWQEIKLAEGGLTNMYNAAIVKFSLANHHGWVEKQQLSGDSKNPLFDFLGNADGKSKELVSDNDT